jgi:hypothetical protein
MPSAAAFEEPLVELRRRIAELEGFPPDGARDDLSELDAGELLDRRYARFRRLGAFEER